MAFESSWKQCFHWSSGWTWLFSIILICHYFFCLTKVIFSIAKIQWTMSAYDILYVNAPPMYAASLLSKWLALLAYVQCIQFIWRHNVTVKFAWKQHTACSAQYAQSTGNTRTVSEKFLNCVKLIYYITYTYIYACVAAFAHVITIRLGEVELQMCWLHNRII